MVEHHCQDPRCACPEQFCPICCHCTCPPGYLTANYGFHRGPGHCPRYEIDARKRERYKS